MIRQLVRRAKTGSVADGDIDPEEVVRLADVLLMRDLEQVDKVVYDSEWLKHVAQILRRWNFRADSLAQQSHDCISLLCQLVQAP